MDGKKYSPDKPSLELLEPEFINEMGKVLNIGKKKYGAENWKKEPLNKETYFGAALRHLMAAMSGEVFDPEDGATHLSKVAVNCMFADWHWHSDNWLLFMEWMESDECKAAIDAIIRNPDPAEEQILERLAMRREEKLR